MKKKKEEELEALRKALNRQSNINIIIMTALIILVLSLTAFIIDDKFLSDGDNCSINISTPVVEPSSILEPLSNEEAKSKGKELYLYAYNTLELLYDVQMSSDHYKSLDSNRYLPINNWSIVSRKFTNDFIDSLDYRNKSSNNTNSNFGIVIIDSIAYGIDGWIGNELNKIVSVDIISKNETEIKFIVKSVVFDNEGICLEKGEICKYESSSELTIKLVGNVWKIDSFNVEIGTTL